MNDNENLPIEAEIVSIRATAEEAKKLNKSLLAKTTIVRQHFAPLVWSIQHGPTRIGNTWYV